MARSSDSTRRDPTGTAPEQQLQARDGPFETHDGVALTRLPPLRELDDLTHGPIAKPRSANEVLALATGRTVPATLADAQAFRIFSLLQRGMSLSDAESLVAAIFKVPSATAKRLVNSAVARYAAVDKVAPSK
jgi:hypothetical protein